MFRLLLPRQCKSFHAIQQHRIIHQQRNYFELLGIEQNEQDIDTIKAAFRKKAKELHPDMLRSKNVSIHDAHLQFVALRSAYEVVVDPISREKYRHSLHNKTHHHLHHHNEASTWQSMHQYQYENIRRGYSRKQGSTTEITPFQLNSWEEFLKEWESALDKAYFGPIFHSSPVNPFPEQMETEERKYFDKTEENERPILQIVHGRQHLGEVSFLSKLPEHLKYIDEMNDHENTNHNKNVDILELKWGQDQWAVGSRFHDVEMQKFQFWYRENPASDKFTSSYLICKEATSFLKTIPDQYSTNGEETHSILRQYSPGVQSILIYNKKNRFLEYKCTRAWLPSSFFWMFEPRDNKFDGGGWYIEHNKDGKYSKYRSTPSSSQQSNYAEHVLASLGQQAMNPDKEVANPGGLKKRLKQNPLKKIESEFEKLSKEDQLQFIEKFGGSTPTNINSLHQGNKSKVVFNAKSLSGDEDQQLMQLRFQLGEVLNNQVELRNREKKLKQLIKKIQRKQTNTSNKSVSGNTENPQTIANRIFSSRKRKRTSIARDSFDHSVLCPLWSLSQQLDEDEVLMEKRIQSEDIVTAFNNTITSVTMPIPTNKQLPVSSMLSQLIEGLDDVGCSTVAVAVSDWKSPIIDHFVSFSCLNNAWAFNPTEIYDSVDIFGCRINSNLNQSQDSQLEKITAIWTNALTWEQKLFMTLAFILATLRGYSMKPIQNEHISDLFQFLSHLLEKCMDSYLQTAMVLAREETGIVDADRMILTNTGKSIATLSTSKMDYTQKSFVVSEKENYVHNLGNTATNNISDVFSFYDVEEIDLVNTVEHLSPSTATEANHTGDGMQQKTVPRCISDDDQAQSNSKITGDKAVTEGNAPISLNELRSYLVKDHYLHQKIVAYIPLELNEVYEKLHQEGVHMSKAHLLKALDALSIFVSAHKTY